MKTTTKPRPSTGTKPVRRMTSNAGLATLVLAAGKGTRMRSELTKVLHPILGVPLVCHVIDRARDLGAAPVVAVVGHQQERVRAALEQRYGVNAVLLAEQREQRGTGHAARIGLVALPKTAHNGTVLVLYGDTPLLTAETLRKLVRASQKTKSLAILTTRLVDPTGYGRILRDARGQVVRVVEEKDADREQRSISEVNAGMYAAPTAFLLHATARLSPKNAQNELYLTDVVAQAARSIGTVTVAAEPDELVGINDRRDLVRAESILRTRVNRRWMEHATLREPESAFIEADVTIETDAEIGRGVTLLGSTHIGKGARIGDGVILRNVLVGEGAVLKPYCVGEDAHIGPGCAVGPFAHLRPGSVLGAEAHVGNFVELKKTHLGAGSKANHLSYLGDSEIGAGVNIGAGTITCNYNGYEKRTTVIEDGAFIGSDSQLVAPVRIGRQAVVAAGATVTRDVPARALAINRAAQQHIEGYAERLAERYGKKLK